MSFTGKGDLLFTVRVVRCSQRKDICPSRGKGICCSRGGRRVVNMDEESFAVMASWCCLPRAV